MAPYGADHSRWGDIPSDMSKADALAYWNAPDAEPSWSKMKKKS